MITTGRTAFPTLTTSLASFALPRRLRAIAVLASSAAANKGLGLFEKIGCASCHVETADHCARGNKESMAARLPFPAALGSITLHPWSDFLMHDVGTGDGILQATREHYGHQVFQQMSGYLSKQDFESSRNKIRTAPLWGVRLRSTIDA